MTCPECGRAMTEGNARVKGTPLGFLFFGFSWQHLWFEPLDRTQRRRKVIESGKARRAHECPGCGAVLIVGR